MTGDDACVNGDGRRVANPTRGFPGGRARDSHSPKPWLRRMALVAPRPDAPAR